jgi:hypothetical protein
MHRRSFLTAASLAAASAAADSTDIHDAHPG